MMAVIFRFSTANGEQSSGLSLQLTEQIVNTLAGVANIELTPEEELSFVESIHTPIRKLGHITEYGLLAIAVAIPLFACHGRRRWNLVLWCGGICVLYACADEIHQLFVPERSGQFLDVLIDSIGITLGIMFFSLVIIIRDISKKAPIKD